MNKNNRVTRKKRVVENKKTRFSTTKKAYKLLGGDIKSNKIFKYIKSIGFEIETTELVKLTLTTDEGSNRKILVNSSLTNNDLEFGFTDEDELIFIIDKKDEKFKITSDTNDDSPLNVKLSQVYNLLNEEESKTGGDGEDEEDGEEDANNEEDDEDDGDDGDDGDEEEDSLNCDNIMVRLKIPDYGIYTVKFRENIDEPLTNCGKFTDTEFISTFYQPITSNNIIKDYLFQSIKQLIQHLNQLRIYNKPKLVIGNLLTKNYEIIDIRQAYVLPDTTLVYYNSLLNASDNYDIHTDLRVTVQMTFSCNVLYIFRIMIQLLTLQEEDINKLKQMNIESITRNTELDIEDIYDVQKFITEIFNNYDKTQSDTNYKFPLENENVKYIKAYLFLIFYKLHKYLNFYLENKDLLKYKLSFAVRHENYILFQEVEKYLRAVFSQNFAGKSEEFINEKIKSILQKLFNERLLNKYIYVRPSLQTLHQQLSKNKDENDFGRPEYSIMSYFEYFLTNKSDWLVDNNIDTKSTKFDLNNNDIIVEYRDFPQYLFMEIYFTGSQEIKNDLKFESSDDTLDISIGTLKKYMAEKGIN